jgi:protein arginine N-methyltransferase 1
MNPLEVDHLLCEPEPICRLDLSKARVADLPTSLEASRRVTRAGRLDGLMLYVKVIFDDQIWFDTSRETLTPSWGNRLFRFPVRELAVGDELRIRVRMPDVRIVKGWQIELD